jgi:hypothetical protein
MFIPDPDLDFLPIPDPGVKKTPDPGSGSATLVFTLLPPTPCVSYSYVQKAVDIGFEYLSGVTLR